MRKKIAVQVAMKEEGLGFAERLSLKEVEMLDPDFGFREFRGNYGQNLEVLLFLQGTDLRYDAEQVGLEAAAVCAATYIQKHKPDLILNFGTAGAFVSGGFQIGEVGLVTGPVRFHDRRVPLKGYFESQEGNHRVANIQNLKDYLQVRTVALSSGSSLEMSPRDEEVLKLHSAEMKEMEGAAIAWIAEKKKIPFVSLKSVTDFIDHHEKSEDQFLKNLSLASRKVQEAARKTLEFLEVRPDDQIWSF